MSRTKDQWLAKTGGLKLGLRKGATKTPKDGAKPKANPKKRAPGER